MKKYKIYYLLVAIAKHTNGIMIRYVGEATNKY